MVSAEYLSKICFAVRRGAGNAQVDSELTDLIEQARADLTAKGVNSIIANDEGNVLVLGAVRCFCRWQFGINGDDAERNQQAYLDIADQIRKKRN